MPGGEIEARELEVHHDRREDVVEVVCDPARERAHRLHLLRLAQLALEAFGLSHVLLNGGEAVGLAVGVTHEERADLHVDERSPVLKCRSWPRPCQRPVSRMMGPRFMPSSV